MVQELCATRLLQCILQKNRMPRIDKRCQQTESGDRL